MDQTSHKFLYTYIEPFTLQLQGDQYYRCMLPAQAIAKRPNCYAFAGHCYSPAIQKAALESDVTYISQAIDEDLLMMMKWRKKQQRITIFEINDYFEAQDMPVHVAEFYGNPKVVSLAHEMAKTADVLVCSSNFLVSKYANLNNHCYLLPNFVERIASDHHIDKSSHRETIHVGWGGSAFHQRDIDTVWPVICSFMSQYQNVHFYIKSPASLKIFIPAHLKGRIHRSFQGSIFEYLNFISQLDIGIIPLLDTEFNSGRSDLKWVEFASCGALPLCQNSVTYASIDWPERRQWQFSKPEDLNHLLGMLVKSPSLLSDLRHSALRFVHQHRSINQLQIKLDSMMSPLLGHKLLYRSSYHDYQVDLTYNSIYQMDDFEHHGDESGRFARLRANAYYRYLMERLQNPKQAVQPRRDGFAASYYESLLSPLHRNDHQATRHEILTQLQKYPHSYHLQKRLRQIDAALQ